MFVKERLAQEGEVLQGVLGAIPSAISVQAIAAAGADFLMIDREHSPVGREAMAAMIAAAAGTGCAPLVRVPRIDEAEVKVAVDAGADGIFLPMVRSAAEVERCDEPLRTRLAMGIEAQFADPRFVAAVEAVERAALAAGVPLAGAALDGARAAELTARGYRALLRGIDLFILQAAVAAFRA
jgi:2-keto-3-deoxy-L-rhamnonate aldolase RhmA